VRGQRTRRYSAYFSQYDAYFGQILGASRLALAVIAKGLQTFVEVGNALLEIRDSRLYRAEFGTFEDYCRQRWQMSYRRAAQLMDAAQVVQNLNNCSENSPTHESQIRALTKLEPRLQPILERAVDTIQKAVADAFRDTELERAWAHWKVRRRT
jgi:hypothetical protein